MIPGELRTGAGEIELNAGRETLELEVLNKGDRPIQVGSHFHFADVNAALEFDRAAATGFGSTSPRARRCASSRAPRAPSRSSRWPARGPCPACRCAT